MKNSIIRPASDNDFNTIYEIINDSAIAYRGAIPSDCWHEPYMPQHELAAQIDDGVKFYCCEYQNRVCGVMGIQDKGDVNLIRHAYVRTAHRNSGIGGILLRHLISGSEKPVLIGTWRAAVWAITFYQKHQFTLVSDEEKTHLLKKYWNIRERQIDTSVVLADRMFIAKQYNQCSGLR